VVNIDVIRRRLVGAAAIAVATLAVAGGAGAADFGANDDTGKYAADGGTGFYAGMTKLGLKQTVLTVRWAPTSPAALVERALLDVTVPAATLAGLKVVFATYPYPPRDIESRVARPKAFAAWLTGLAHDYPGVRQYVVGNEPNQPAFFRPQFVHGKQASAARFGPFLAAGYDALKAVDGTITVIGVGLSPRGNDRPSAKSNISTSPVRFLAALGRWYRRSGRKAPLMDGFGFHPYPNRATDPLARGYSWPAAGFANLDRIKQSLWDAFAGTPQPTTVNGLKLYLGEVGWQVDTGGLPGYVGVENVAVTDEQTQATVYRQLVLAAQCDSDIAEVDIFGFVDDPVRTGFQSALHRADGSPRPAAQAVGEAIAQGCALPSTSWEPSQGVIGATEPMVTARNGKLVVKVAAKEGATARVCLLTGEPTTKAIIRALARPSTVGCVRAVVSPQEPTTLTIGRGLVSVGTVAVRLTAGANPRRRTVATYPLP
jgi:hypothetical protein